MWKRWFPAYKVPKTIDDLVRAGVLVDGTHSDDATPHFEAKLAGGYLVLWVDHPNPALRYFEDGPRYTIDIHEPEKLPSTIFETDRLDETLEVMRQLLSEGKGMRLL
jgi:hypothetical protein